jgi:hypothetical protein
MAAVSALTDYSFLQLEMNDINADAAYYAKWGRKSCRTCQSLKWSPGCWSDVVVNST